ncbi:MAG: GAF domain-containing protein [Polyangiaceae bacterium]|nr:GAF domain-containing protein [Polyangiaceae bacterium]
MQLHIFHQTVFRPQPPPLWYVSDGERSVGPVLTGRLVDHVQAGQVPDWCRVRLTRGRWRKLDFVREISAIKRPMNRPSKAAAKEAFLELSYQTGCIRDEDEFLHETTEAARAMVGGQCAMLHCFQRSVRAMVTRSVVGRIPTERLGQPLPDDDPVLQVARLNRPVFGPPYGPTEDALARRFAYAEGGVGAAAMIPISIDGTVSMMLEVSRPGHAFRRGDLQRAEQLVQRMVRMRSN